MLMRMNSLYDGVGVFMAPDDGGVDVVTDTPPDADDIIIVDELPKDEPEEDLLGGKSVKDIIAENEALRQQADQAGAIQRGIADLGTVLTKQKPPEAPAQKPGETREEYAKRFNKEFFGTSSYDVFEDAVKRVVSPYVSQLQQSVATVNRNLYKDDFIYSKYKDEVEGKISALPADQQAHPGVVEWAIKQVKAEHIDDIVEMKINEKLESIQQQTPAQPARNVNNKATFVEGGGTVGAGGGDNKPKAITKAETAMVNVYMGRGMSKRAAVDKVIRDRSR